MRLLLVNPIDAKDQVETYFPHLGLGYLANVVRNILGWECAIIGGHSLAYYLDSWKPDVVGITSVSQYYDQAVDYAFRCKVKELPVIVGGAHISALPETMTEDMDVAVLGEAENTILDLLRALNGKKDWDADRLAKIPGVAYWSHGQVVKTPPRPLISDLDLLPFPDRGHKTWGHVSMFTSRGCPHRCAYCYSSRFWGKVRMFSADYVVAEVQHLCRQGAQCISFLDDLFVVSEKRLAAIVEGLGKAGMLRKSKFVCHVRSEWVTEAVADMLKEMGVNVVGIGIESGSQKTLDYLKGRVTVADNHRALAILRSRRIAPHPSFIIGSPHETAEDMHETVRFIQSEHIKDFEIYVLIPFPGTPVWDYARARGLVNETMPWCRLAWDYARNPDPVILSEECTKAHIDAVYYKLLSRRQWYVRQAQVTGAAGIAGRRLVRMVKRVCGRS